ncbi:MAG: hypothetical protein GY832_10440 [Chloroflexi bacterium]|nr:hypothetical protein [Chloroflexota bacterium]
MDELTLCVTPSVLLIAIFATIIVTRYFKHREIMAMVEKGVLPEQYAQYTSASRKQRGRGTMGWGIALAALGLALMAGLWPLGFVGLGGNAYPLNFGPWMLVGLVPLFMGVALLIIYFVMRKEDATMSKASEKLEEPFDDD